MVLMGSLVLLVGTASAHSAHAAGLKTGPSKTCAIHSFATFVAQGEFKTTATVADIIEVECNPVEFGTGSEIEVTASQLFTRCKGKDLWIVPNPFKTVANKLSIKLKVDADGNATVGIIAGPECSPGESLISVHELEEPFETATTSFTVLAPKNTKEELLTLPAAQVEDAGSSAVITVAELEVTGGSEKKYRVASPELFARCRVKPHLHWFNEEKKESKEVREVKGEKLDNNGNGFVVIVGDSSCAEGKSLIEADLESKPFTTYTTEFLVEAPRETPPF
jgi:hypothetical protein